MKHIKVLFSALVFGILAACSLNLSCATSKESEVKQTSKSTEAPQGAPVLLVHEKGTFDYEGFDNIPWGTLRADIEDTSDFAKDGITAKWYDNQLVAYNAFDNPYLNGFLVSWGFENNKLVYGTILYVPVNVKNTKKLVLFCNAHVYSMLEEMGPPTLKLDSTMIWQNPNTHVQIYCTEKGVVVDWYSRIWLTHNSDFVAHLSIPQEAMRGFGKELFRSNGNFTQYEENFK
jgi:hypothetical protein